MGELAFIEKTLTNAVKNKEKVLILGLLFIQIFLQNYLFDAFILIYSIIKII